MEWVAQITKDLVWRPGDDKFGITNKKDKLFAFDAMRDWWGWEDYLSKDDIPEEKTTFKLYDDDGELYYAGWLHNDDECIVQQFVLKWAEVDSGCTTIMVYKNPEAGYVQEIG